MPAKICVLNNHTPHTCSSLKPPDFLQKRLQTYYIDRVKNAWGGGHPLRGSSPGPESVQMRTNDYLCLTGHPHVIQAEVKTLQECGHGDSISRVWLHQEKDSLQIFEERLARLTLAEDAVLCASGYCANVGLIQSIADSSVPVYLDFKAHISLWEGAISAKASAVPFRHNDPAHLQQKVRQYGAGIVIVDALYSTDGDISPMEDIIEVVEQYGCVMVVDETHSFGAHGTDGGGLVVKLDLAERVHFRTIGLSKAVASRGGAIVCSKKSGEFLRYESLPVIFSTSVLQHEVAGYNAVLDVFAKESWRREKLHINHDYLKMHLQDIGYSLENCKSQILALEAGDIQQTMKLRDALESRGVFGAMFLPPATPEKRCLIRFTLNCGLKKSELDHVIAVCRDIYDELKVEEWPSTQRMRRRRKKRQNIGSEKDLLQLRTQHPSD